MFSSQSRFNLAFAAALIEGRIRPHFQPIVSLADQSITGFEVLARWFDEDQGSISPSVFVEYADRGGMLDDLLDLLMREAFKAAQQWPGHITLAFNVSPTQLRDCNLATRLHDAAIELGFSPSNVNIEITEASMLEDASLSTINKMRSLGCAISLDDFGTGYSSLTWLRTLPFSTVKIDTSFVRAMTGQKESRKIVTAVVGLGQSLGFSVIAEGVETTEQQELLTRIGCSSAQGHLFGRAVPAAEVLPMLAAAQPAPQGAHSRTRMSRDNLTYQASSLYQSSEILVLFVDNDLNIVNTGAGLYRFSEADPMRFKGHHISALPPAFAILIEELRAMDGVDENATASRVVTSHANERYSIIAQVVLDEMKDPIGYSIFGCPIETSTAPERRLYAVDR
ncbi:EAL domain-containing protein [Acuticoccus sp. M5D2P5]|nr:EAL domain-containing protein [Acuticoccus kalidii]MCF3932020.1 EAL domain-containing protein [Acuticoccus kalidii]